MSNSVTKETMMAYNSGVSNSMTGQDGGVVGQGVGHHWGVDSVSHSRGVVGGGGGVVFWVLGLAVVGHISNISVVIIGVVVDVLDSAIRKSNGVRSLGVTGTVGRLGSIEVCLGVVVTHSVGVAVGGGGVIAGGVVGGSVNSVGHNGSVDCVGNNRSMNTMS